MTEWFYSDTESEYQIKDVQTFKVDGETIKADAWYILKDGNAVEKGAE